MDIDLEVNKILETLTRSGFEIAIVGGAVREIIANKPPTDWDLTTNAKPEQILKLFKNAFYNNRFGTVGIPIQDQRSKVPPKARLAKGGKDQRSIVQITTYRKEEKYTDRRHPDVIVWGKTLEEDLARRDFTINAMALRYQISKIKNQNLELIDPFGG